MTGTANAAASAPNLAGKCKCESAGWKPLLAYQPNALIFTGDNVYGDLQRDFYGDPTEALVELEAAYHNQSKQIGFSLARAATPLVYATWVRLYCACIMLCHCTTVFKAA